jgi:phage terminase small subunit
MNPRQQRFVQEYLVSLNATKAAIAAGYSERSAHVHGCKLLKEPKVAAEIAVQQRAAADRAGISVDRVIQELARIAFANMEDFARFGGDAVDLVDSGSLTREQLAAVAELGQTASKYGNSVRFKLHDKIRAVELIGKHLGMFVDRHTVAAEGGGFKLEIHMGDEDGSTGSGVAQDAGLHEQSGTGDESAPSADDSGPGSDGEPARTPEDCEGDPPEDSEGGQSAPRPYEP